MQSREWVTRTWQQSRGVMMVVGFSGMVGVEG